jgi:hypothetical protein
MGGGAVELVGQLTTDSWLDDSLSTALRRKRFPIAKSEAQQASDFAVGAGEGPLYFDFSAATWRVTQS